jgi:hypothetical protein
VMISSKRLDQMAKKWQRMAAIARKKPKLKDLAACQCQWQARATALCML